MNLIKVMEVVTKNMLHTIAEKAKKELDERIITSITQQVYNRVMYVVNNFGSNSVKWSIDDYVFDDAAKVQPLHVVSACVRIQRFFPDSKIYRPSPREIVVDWS